jgi:hypothetical protein
MQHIGGRFILLFIVVIVLWWGAVVLANLNLQGAIYGWNVGPNGTLINVTPGLPAARAGLRVGDRIDWASFLIRGRANITLDQDVPPGSSLNVAYFRGALRHSAIITPATVPFEEQTIQNATAVPGLVLAIIAAALVFLRPSRMTWGLLLCSLQGFYPNVFTHWAQQSVPHFLFVNGVYAILISLYAGGLLTFVARFPANRPAGALVWVDRAAIPAGAFYGAVYLYIDYALAFSNSPPASWALAFLDYIGILLLLLTALSALVAAYVLNTGSNRQRIVPVLAALTLNVAAQTAGIVGSALFTSTALYTVLNSFTMLSLLLLAAAVLHAVLRHRVFDVSFAISKTVVYTIVTSVVVGVFVLIDFVSGKLLSGLRVTLVLEACAALAFGIWLNAIHNRIDRFVDRVLFRKRHLAEARLERAARSLPHAQSHEYIDDVLVTEACDALELASAAVFRKTETGYARMRAMGWETQHASALSGDDRLVVALKAELQPIDLTQIHRAAHDFPSELAQPLLALPFVARHEIVGFVLYGGHAGGEAIDPDEQRVLERLAHASAAAYEYLHATALQDEARQLRTENALLRQLSGVPSNG